jgi:hypothetical protein
MRFYEPIDRRGRVLVLVPPQSVSNAATLPLEYKVVSADVQHEIDQENQPTEESLADAGEQANATASDQPLSDRNSSALVSFRTASKIRKLTHPRSKPSAKSQSPKPKQKTAPKKTPSKPAAKPSAPASGSFFSRYQTYDSIVSWLKGLSTKYPRLCKFLPSIGKTVQGRAIPLVIITSDVGQNKPIVYIEGMLHAREWYVGVIVSPERPKILS